MYTLRTLMEVVPTLRAGVVMNRVARVGCSTFFLFRNRGVVTCARGTSLSLGLEYSMGVP